MQPLCRRAMLAPMLDLTRQRWFDISPPITDKIAVFPGDTPFERQVLMDFQQGNHLELSTIRTTVHLGAHTDAPNHYHADGQGIHQRNLNYYVGLCEVRHVPVPPRTRLTPAHLQDQPPRAPRLLLRTDTFRDPETWTNDFAALTPELVHWLADHGVLLVGIDTPSVDLADDRVLASHHAIFERDLAILEGIVLDEVADGLYTLIALPLRLVGLDASPVRAILVQNEEDLVQKAE